MRARMRNLERTMNETIGGLRERIQQLETAGIRFANLPGRIEQLNAEIEKLKSDAVKFGAVALKENKWENVDWLKSENGFEVDCPSSHPQGYHWHSIRAKMPVRPYKCAMLDMPTIFCYFEVEKQKDFGVGIGFGECNFPLTSSTIGNTVDCNNSVNSVGVWSKADVLFNGSERLFPNFTGKFSPEDVIGCGLSQFAAHSPIKFFATCNAEYLGSVVLPPKFDGIQLYPIATMYLGESIKANFGHQPFLYDITKHFEHDNI